jgi:hypothetical protein
MTTTTEQSTTSAPRKAEGITRISVSGYKSIRDEQSVEIRPLTLLAGANSSGKSSIMQPLLLMKQTLDAGYDPGAILLDGPNVKFTSVDQLLSHTLAGGRVQGFRVAIEDSWDSTLTTSFRQTARGMNIDQMVYVSPSGTTSLAMGLSEKDLVATVPFLHDLGETITRDTKLGGTWSVVRDRCFLTVRYVLEKGGDPPLLAYATSPSLATAEFLRAMIHVPGLRGNPERSYPVTAVGGSFAGTFEKYAASLVAAWQVAKAPQLAQLGRDLATLGLTWKVAAQPINDTQVEIRVGRIPRPRQGGARDLVSIADVGFGVSQTLPVLAALLAAQPSQLVYIEQPEIHLHPRAQVALAQSLANAALRGVRVVAETHSALLLLGVQSLVAQGKLPANLVKLHWFGRDQDGATRVTSADLDDSGAFGSWPEDFAEVTMGAQQEYLDAAETSLRCH